MRGCLHLGSATYRREGEGERDRQTDIRVPAKDKNKYKRTTHG